jgi:hypothetical protein
VARVDGNNIGDVLTFWRDEKVNPDAVFARSNMFWDEYKVTWTMSLPGGYDGVTWIMSTRSPIKGVHLSAD